MRKISELLALVVGVVVIGMSVACDTAALNRKIGETAEDAGKSEVAVSEVCECDPCECDPCECGISEPMASVEKGKCSGCCQGKQGCCAQGGQTMHAEGLSAEMLSGLDGVFVLASLTISEGAEEEVLAACEAMIEATRQEDGNLLYILVANELNGSNYTFVEVWESEDALITHQSTDTYIEFQAAIADKAEVSLMTGKQYHK